MNRPIDARFARGTRRAALQAATDGLLTIEDAETARLDAEILLRHLLHISRAQLYTHLDSPLTVEQQEEYMRLIERRLRREPVSYITQNKEFFGLDFYVNQNVLIPRPETELLVEKALEWARGHKEPEGGWKIADVGTGSGAIAVSLALNLPSSKVLAIDISNDALQVARKNCEQHGVSERIKLRRGDLLTNIGERFHIIVANLPYVAGEELLGLSPDIREYEPPTALHGGADGLDLYRRLFDQAPQAMEEESLLLAEIGAGQGQAILEIARQAFPAADIAVVKDYAGLERMIVASVRRA